MSTSEGATYVQSSSISEERLRRLKGTRAEDGWLSRQTVETPPWPQHLGRRERFPGQEASWVRAHERRAVAEGSRRMTRFTPARWMKRRTTRDQIRNTYAPAPVRDHATAPDELHSRKGESAGQESLPRPILPVASRQLRPRKASLGVKRRHFIQLWRVIR